jgi:GNAT superfamily N-acetyltransferase
VIEPSVRPVVAGDRSWKVDALRRTWGSTAVARKGELVDAAGLPGFVAIIDGEVAGLLTYAVRNDGIEVVTIHSEPEGRGAGRALMDAVRRHAEELGVGRIWLITTNDNVRALCFYQQWGMDLVALHQGAVAASRAVKPTIPTIGQHRIPVRHELELELRVVGQAPADFQK